MAKQNPRLPVRYFYLDVDGIDSLYAQTAEALVTELTYTQEKGRSRGVTTNISTGKLLGALVGVEMGVEAELSTAGKAIEEAKMHLTTEQKLSALMKYLSGLAGEGYFEQLPQAAIYSSKTGKAVYINVNQKFDMPQFSHGKDGIAEVNRDKSFAFTIGPVSGGEYDTGDEYFKKTQYTFIMMASVSHTPAKDKMSYARHEAVYFRALAGKDVPLGLFGQLIPLGKYAYQIKPYAIWK